MKNLKELEGSGALIKVVPFFIWDGENELEIVEHFGFTSYSLTDKFTLDKTEGWYARASQELTLYMNDKVWYTLQEGDIILADKDVPGGIYVTSSTVERIVEEAVVPSYSTTIKATAQRVVTSKDGLARYAASRGMDYYFKEEKEGDVCWDEEFYNGC